MHVHGLDADASRSRHTRQAHVRAAEKARAEALELDLHADGRILVQKRTRFYHDALTGLELALEHVAVTVQQNQPGAIGSDEAIHEHALAAEQNVAQTFHPDERIIDLVRP